LQTDTWRPAAYEQLKQLAESIHVDFFGDKTIKDPVQLYKSFEKQLDEYDVVLIDTAGRDNVSEELLLELSQLDKAVQADERFLVIGADIGQGAQHIAQAFQQDCAITGVIVSKLDGSAKGGGALSACAACKAPIMFIGIGESVKDLDKFDPKRFVSRLLRMGDLTALLEKAQEAFSQEDAVDVSKKLLKGDFNLVDLYQQIEGMKKMGPMTKVMDLIPGMGSMRIPKELLEGEEQNMKKWKFIIDSCTKEEVEDPSIISGYRVKRISEGSGTAEEDVRGLLKKYRMTKKLLKKFKPGSKQMKQMMKQFGGKMPDNLVF